MPVIEHYESPGVLLGYGDSGYGLTKEEYDRVIQYTYHLPLYCRANSERHWLLEDDGLYYVVDKVA